MDFDDLERAFSDKFGPTEPMFWLLDETGQKPVAVDMETWIKGCRAFHKVGTDERSLIIVRQETIGRSWISTVFLTVKIGAPVWETMVFGGALDHRQWQCSGNREQAEAQHNDVIKLVRRAERWWLWKPAVERFLEDQLHDYPELQRLIAFLEREFFLATERAKLHLRRLKSALVN